MFTNNVEVNEILGLLDGDMRSLSVSLAAYKDGECTSLDVESSIGQVEPFGMTRAVFGAIYMEIKSFGEDHLMLAYKVEDDSMVDIDNLSGHFPTGRVLHVGIKYHTDEYDFVLVELTSEEDATEFKLRFDGTHWDAIPRPSHWPKV